MTDPSTRTTGNDSVEGLDPGGTHSTRNHAGTPGETRHAVESGDRNTSETSKMTPAVEDGKSDSGPGET